MRHTLMLLAVLGLAAGMAGCMAGGKGPGGSTMVARVSAGAERDYVDGDGLIWKADQQWAEGKKWGAIGGETVQRTGLKIARNVKATEVYLTERYGMTGYRFDVPNGTYAVRLHFAETYDGITKAGERVFTVKVQGKLALADFDVLKAAGKFATPVVKEVPNVAVSDGKLMIEFVENVQKAEINGIEVFAY